MKNVILTIIASVLFLTAFSQRPFNPDSLREHQRHFTRDSIHRNMMEISILHFANAQLITTDSSEHLLDTLAATDKPTQWDVRIMAFCNKTKGGVEKDIVVRDNGGRYEIGHIHLVTNWQPPLAAPIAQVYERVQDNKVCLFVRGQQGVRIKWILAKTKQL